MVITLIRRLQFEFKTITSILIVSLLIPLVLQGFSTQAQNNELLIYEQKVSWIYINNATSIQRPLNAFRISYSPSTVDVVLSSPLSTQANVSISINMIVNFIGGERLHYLITSMAENSSHMLIKENVEGNMAIDVRNIIIQWHKYEVVIPGAYNFSIKSDFLKPLLNDIINNKSYNVGGVIENGNGVYTLVAEKNKLMSSISLIDVYLNKTSYTTHYLNGIQGCNVIDYLPMRTDIRFNINASKGIMDYHMYVNGLEISDPLNSYRAMLCLLPSLTLIQDIVERIELNLTASRIFAPRISDELLKSIIPAFSNTFAINVLSGYSKIFSSQNISSNTIFISLFNSTSTGYVVALGIYNINTSHNIDYYKKWMCNISNYMIRPYLGADFCGIIKNATVHAYIQSSIQPQPPSNFSNTFSWLLIAIITIVSIETAAVVYMALKVLRHGKHI